MRTLLGFVPAVNHNLPRANKAAQLHSNCPSTNILYISITG